MFWIFPIFCDFSAQALRKMGAFNKKRRHPRAVNNLEAEEEMPEKVSLRLVHLHDQVSNRLLFFTLTFFLTEICLSSSKGEWGRSLGDCSVLSPTDISLLWKPIVTSSGKPAQLDHCQVLRIRLFLQVIDLLLINDKYLVNLTSSDSWNWTRLTSARCWTPWSPHNWVSTVCSLSPALESWTSAGGQIQIQKILDDVKDYFVIGWADFALPWRTWSCTTAQVGLQLPPHLSDFHISLLWQYTG